MLRISQQRIERRILLAGLFGIGGCAALQCACAEPPLDRFAAAPSRESNLSHESNLAHESTLSGEALSHESASLRESQGSHDSWTAPALSLAVDLRLPAEGTARDEIAPSGAAPAAAAAGRRRPFRIEALAESFAGESRSPAGSLTPAAAQSAPLMSPLENMAHRFREDGLPVARLFQHGNSLVHLGLNPRGKPGLWFVQKLH